MSYGTKLVRINRIKRVVGKCLETFSTVCPIMLSRETVLKLDVITHWDTSMNFTVPGKVTIFIPKKPDTSLFPKD
jgi:hypothetical protein